MIRRRPVIVAALVVASAAALSGCATFDNNDVVARVGDAELTESDLRTVLTPGAESGDDQPTSAPSDLVSTPVNNWIVDRVLRADLSSNGSPLDEVEGAITAETLSQSVQSAFQAWSAATPTEYDSATIQGLYERGPAGSGVICVSHILVDTKSVADDVAGRASDGEDFGALAAEYSFDPGSAENGGVLPCSATADFANTYVFEFASAALEGEVGDVIGPVESQFGFHVIKLRPFEELSDDEAAQLAAEPQVRFMLAVESNDVWVNPRFGEFDGARGLQPVA